jgi:hypothetical protein
MPRREALSRTRRKCLVRSDAQIDAEDLPWARLAFQRSEAEIAVERQVPDAERAAEALSYAVRELAVCCDGAPPLCGA